MGAWDQTSLLIHNSGGRHTFFCLGGIALAGILTILIRHRRRLGEGKLMAPLVISLVLTGIRFSWSRYRLPALTDLMEMSLPPSPEGFHLDPLVYLLSGLLALTVMILFYRVDSPFQKAGLLALISLPSLSAVFYWWSSTALGNLMVIRAGGMGGIYGYGCILAPLLSLATEMGVVFLFLFVFPARKRGGVPADPPPRRLSP